MHRPDLRNFSLEDLLMVKNFQSLTKEEQEFKANTYALTVHDLNILSRFGTVFEPNGERDSLGREMVSVMNEDWLEPIAETTEQLAAMDLPLESCDTFGKFTCAQDKWREGKFDLGWSGYEHISY